MKPRALSTGPASHASVATERTCSLCGEELIRIRRRAIDRLLSLFVPVQRYRCPRFSCQWEGNLRVGSRAADTMTKSPR